MVLFDGSFVRVSQSFFGGWRIFDKVDGATYVPDRFLKEKIGYVWMQVRRTKKALSIDSNMSEDVMFGSFAHATMEPHAEAGQLWFSHSADELANLFIEQGNEFMRQAYAPFRRFPKA